jgi:hypothetical protein
MWTKMIVPLCVRVTVRPSRFGCAQPLFIHYPFTVGTYCNELMGHCRRDNSVIIVIRITTLQSEPSVL